MSFCGNVFGVVVVRADSIVLKLATDATLATLATLASCTTRTDATLARAADPSDFPSLLRTH